MFRTCISVVLAELWGVPLAHSDLVQSVLRIADILEIVSSSAEGVTLSEISGRLCLKGPTVHNLLRTLVSRGLLDRGRRPIRYRIGGGLYQIVRTSFERSVSCRARGVVQRVLSSSGAISASFAEVVGGEVCLILRVDEQRPDYVEGLGNRPLHPYASGSSLVYQAFMSAGDLAHYRERHPFAIQGAPFWGSADCLDEFLSGVRSTGVATVPFGDGGQIRVSGAVRHIDGSIAGAVTCVFSADGGLESPESEEARTEHLEAVVRAVAEELSMGSADTRAGGPEVYGNLE